MFMFTLKMTATSRSWHRTCRASVEPNLPSISHCGARWEVQPHAADVDGIVLVQARDAPHFLAHQVALAWERRWTRMLSVACASSFAASLVAILAQAICLCSNTCVVCFAP